MLQEIETYTFNILCSVRNNMQKHVSTLYERQKREQTQYVKIWENVLRYVGIIRRFCIISLVNNDIHNSDQAFLMH